MRVLQSFEKPAPGEGNFEDAFGTPVPSKPAPAPASNKKIARVRDFRPEPAAAPASKKKMSRVCVYHHDGHDREDH